MNSLFTNIFIVLITTFLSFFITNFFLPFSRKLLLDKPNKRSSHLIPTPSSGGFIFSLIGSLGSSIMGNFMPQICFILSITGLVDDKYAISQFTKYFSQIFVLILLFLNSPASEIFNEYPYLEILFFLISIFSSSAIINFFNFMDGMDGLLAGCMFIYIFTAIILCKYFFLLPLLGALLGFLFLNWSPAKIFMGDSGSLFLGGIYSGILFSSSDLTQIFSLLLITIPLTFDAAICVIRRFLNSESIFQPHKKNLYQRLHQRGWSHSKVSTNYIFISFLLSISLLLGGLYFLLITSLLILIYGYYLDRKIAIPFK